MIFNKAIVKKKKPIFTVSIVVLRQHNCFSIFSPDFFRRSYDFKQSDNKKKEANIHSRYRCPETTCVIPIFSRDFFRRSYDFKQSDSKNKKLIFTAGIVVQRQHHFFSDFHSLFFFIARKTVNREQTRANIFICLLDHTYEAPFANMKIER